MHIGRKTIAVTFGLAGATCLATTGFATETITYTYDALGRFWS